MPSQLNFAARRQDKEEQPAVRLLRIKANTLKRTIQDLVFAQEEVAREEQRLETMRHSQSDRTKQQESVVNEAKIMVPDAANRIRSAIHDLRSYIDNQGSGISDMSALIEGANDMISEGERVLSSV